ncbi:MAG: response regulator [Planctomycetaceae bacterium]|nr:response regulator [Planctomycetaceae bacterium]
MLLGRRILLADDDSALRVGVAELLASLGLDVRHAESGLEAVELARVGRFHAALLDLHMPGCSGLEAIQMLRQSQRDLPCIVYSGRLSRELEREALDLGVVAVLHKPVAPDLLRREVLRAVNMGSALGGDGPQLYPGS